MPVAVAHDATPAGRAALAQALRWAELHETSVVVLHAVEGKAADESATQAETVREQVTSAAADYGASAPQWEVRTAPGARGVAPAVLAMVAECGASVLVVGSKRRTEVGKFFLGGTVQRLLLDSPVPVLVVKPD